MKNFKRIIGILLAITLCFSTAVIVSAEDTSFSPEVDIVAIYNNDATAIEVAVVSDKEYGAIKATLGWSGAVDFDTTESPVFIEKETAETDALYTESENTITFVVASDNDAGDKAWAKFHFNVNSDSKDAIVFTLEDVQIASVDAVSLDDAVKVDSVKIVVDTAEKTLGETTYTLADEAISAVPFVVYKDGTDLKVQYGEKISKSYNEVMTAVTAIS